MSTLLLCYIEKIEWGRMALALRILKMSNSEKITYKKNYITAIIIAIVLIGVARFCAFCYN